VAAAGAPLGQGVVEAGVAVGLAARALDVVPAAGAQAALVNIDIEERVQAAAVQTGLETARRQAVALEKGLARLNSANLQLLTETLLMDWPRISS